MKIAVYGGSFDPPHPGHSAAVRAALQELQPDIMYVIPANISPGKNMQLGCNDASKRLEMARLAFGDIPGVIVSDMELVRGGTSYTAETLDELQTVYPGAELFLVLGSDALDSITSWHRYESIVSRCTLAVISRYEDDGEKLQNRMDALSRENGVKSLLLDHEALPMGSCAIRQLLPLRQGADMLSDAVYSYIIRNNLYGAQPELAWLREKSREYLKPGRIAHVAGVESEAVMLAKRYGEDEDMAATAGMLHDITKKLSYDEQLLLCEKYGIICDDDELANPALLHAKTGAVLSKDVFGISESVSQAIRWHTTGRPDMNGLEKIIYLADFIEPTRDFPGVDALREAAYEDLDAGMRLGLELSLEDIRSRNIEPYKDTVEAFIWYNTKEDNTCSLPRR